MTNEFGEQDTTINVITITISISIGDNIQFQIQWYGRDITMKIMWRIYRTTWPMTSVLLNKQFNARFW